MQKEIGPQRKFSGKDVFSKTDILWDDAIFDKDKTNITRHTISTYRQHVFKQNILIMS